MSSAVSDKAGELLSALFRIDDATRAEFENATNLIPPLIDALRSAPRLAGRSLAAYLLQVLADEHPEECTPMVEAGTVSLVLALYRDVWRLHPEQWDPSVAWGLLEPAAALVHVLVRSETGAAQALRQGICSLQEYDTFIALLVVLVRLPAHSLGRDEHAG
jgi:hypothetical protein